MARIRRTPASGLRYVVCFYQREVIEALRFTEGFTDMADLLLTVSRLAGKQQPRHLRDRPGHRL